MCSCNISRFHVYRPEDTLVQNLFRLDFRPPSNVQFWLCDCPSSYLNDGLVPGVPLAAAMFVSAMLWWRLRKLSIAIGALALAVWLAEYLKSASRTIGIIEHYRDEWHSSIASSLVLQGAFDLMFYVCGPILLALMVRGAHKIIRKAWTTS